MVFHEKYIFSIFIRNKLHSESNFIFIHQKIKPRKISNIKLTPIADLI